MSYYNQIFKNIKINEPIFIKNFFRDDEYQESIKEIIDLVAPSNGSTLLRSKNNLLINTFLKKIKKNEHIKVSDDFEVSHYKKNDLVYYHYNLIGVDEINTCFGGKILFILTKPNSQLTYPFTNLTMFAPNNEEYKYVLEPKDLLLIPRFWFYSVISLKNKTVRLNFHLTTNYDNVPANFKMLYNLHKLFNTHMKNVPICNFPNLSISKVDFILFFLKENILLFILILILRLMINEIFYFKIKNNLDKFLIINSLVEWKYCKNTWGMSRLLGINVLLNNLLIDLVIR